MGKVVLVTSFDAPEDNGEYQEMIRGIMGSLKDLVDHKANRHVWIGAGEQGRAVLNVIGVD